MGNKKTTEDFISQAMKVHGDVYDYSRTVYTHSRVKVEIICKVHGSFYVTPHNHLSCKNGCRKCSVESRTYNTAKFVERANEVHNHRYTYDNTTYVKSKTKVKIVCQTHGEFLQTPANHLSGYGCEWCSIDSRRIGKEDFEKRANITHKHKFDYSEAVYVRTDVKIRIICPIHGVFEQQPHSHLKGDGCPECSKNKQYTTETAIAKTRQIHGGAIEFIDTYRNNTKEKYKFSCKCGNIWLTTFDSIVQKKGCPACAVTGFNRSRGEAYFYVFDVNGVSNFTKFGISGNIKDRFRDHRLNLKNSNCFYSNIILIQLSGDVAYELERYILTNYTCGVSNIKGFRRESTHISSITLLNICKEWLTYNSKEYKICKY